MNLNTTTSLHEEHHELLPTPISPTTTHHDFESLISQFSIKDTEDNKTIKSFPCNECHQVFHRAHNLKSHKATHSASKPFQCTDCDKQFLRQHDLKRHKKLHTGERPYHCPVCNRSFSRLDALNRHRKTEGGSACLKTSTSSPSSSPATKKSDITPLFIPSMTTQWQVLPSPSTMLSNIHSSPQAPPTTISHSPPLLPSLVLPLQQEFSNDKSEGLVDNLRQRIHDLEIENRVLRSLLCNNEKTPPPPLSKKKLMIEEEEDEELLKRQKRSP